MTNMSGEPDVYDILDAISYATWRNNRVRRTKPKRGKARCAHCGRNLIAERETREVVKRLRYFHWNRECENELWHTRTKP